jgi:glucose-6-phosphate isomerase
MIVGTSALEPGTIGEEYYMTRGHLHAKVDRPEVYHCVHGRGVMLLEDSLGNVDSIEMTPGTVAYVAPGWIHRSVNVGSDRFVTVFSYPADSGQNYEVIAEAGGMAALVVVDGGHWKLADNPRYVRR